MRNSSKRLRVTSGGRKSSREAESELIARERIGTSAQLEERDTTEGTKLLAEPFGESTSEVSLIPQQRYSSKESKRGTEKKLSERSVSNVVLKKYIFVTCVILVLSCKYNGDFVSHVHKINKGNSYIISVSSTY